MAENSAIEWTDHTFNPWIGCTKVSPGCDHCYAERREDKRLHRVQWGSGQPRQRTKTWGDPVRWNKQPFFECLSCRWRGPDSATITIDNPPGFHPPVAWTRGCPACRQPTLKEARARVFCASLADVFDNQVRPEWRADLFRLIESTPHLDWLLLTKRVGNAAEMMFQARGGHLPLLPNLWLGATVVNREEMLRDGPKLKAVPAMVRFWSVEPMLGDLGWIPRALLPDWIICGGESGPGARPMHPAWVRNLRDQCADAGVPFLFKQWGEWVPADDTCDGVVPVTEIVGDVDWKEGKRVRVQWLSPNDSNVGHSFARIGRKAAGRQLDGREHDGFPED